MSLEGRKVDVHFTPTQKQPTSLPKRGETAIHIDTDVIAKWISKVTGKDIVDETLQLELEQRAEESADTNALAQVVGKLLLGAAKTLEDKEEK